MVEIRRADEHDAEALAAFEARFPELRAAPECRPSTPEECADEIAEGHTFLAFDGGVLVGFSSGAEAEGGWGSINGLAVAPTHRRQGLARALQRALVGSFREAGCKGACTWAHATSGSLAMFRGEGYTTEGTYTYCHLAL